MIAYANYENYSELLNEGFVIVDFFSETCGPCKVLDITVDQVIFDNPMVNLAKCNTDDDPSFVERFGIVGTPTLIFFNDGRETGRFAGAWGRDKVEEYLSQCMYS